MDVMRMLSVTGYAWYFDCAQPPLRQTTPPLGMSSSSFDICACAFGQSIVATVEIMMQTRHRQKHRIALIMIAYDDSS